MQATLNLDQDADLTTLPESYQSKIKFRPSKNGPIAYFPQGCVFDGDHALHLVSTGQASPSDDECAKACGMSPQQLAANARRYAAADVGIHGKADMAMFMAGAIVGYGPGTTDDKPVYIKGPNWDAYQAALAKKSPATASDV